LGASSLQHFLQALFWIESYVYEKYGSKKFSKKNGPAVPSEQDFAAKVGQLTCNAPKGIYGLT
jgi:hypothetical protein